MTVSITHKEREQFLLHEQDAVRLETMARGNWQRRVENAESRRLEQRDRKARQKEETSKKSDYQKYVRHLFTMIDEHYTTNSWNSTKSTIVIHLWLDKIPLSESKNSSSRNDVNFEQKQQSEHKKTTVASNNKKACHPRSNADFSKNNNNTPDIQYCRQFFFYAQCSANTTINANGSTHSPCTQKLPTSCIHHLYHVHPSLVECISLRDGGYNHSGSSSSSTALLSELKLSFEAAALRRNNSNGDNTQILSSIVDPAMNPLFHLCLNFSPQQNYSSDCATGVERLHVCNEKEGEHITCPPSVYIPRYLATEQVSVTNIVYLVMDGKFWYDRYRGSVLLPPASLSLTSNDNTKKANISENTGNSAKEVRDKKANIPSNLLLLIFIFLPDQYVTKLSMVCKAYAKEIASNKNLWSFLLQRRGWPTSNISVGHTTSTNTLEESEQHECNHHRNSYFSHVMALTLLQTLSQNVTCLVGGGGKGGSQSSNTTINCNNVINLPTAKNYNFLSFRATNGAPNIDDKCVALKILNDLNNSSKNDTIQAIGAFSRDGTIRAFELTPFGKKNNNTSNTRGTVRQIACVRATPLVRNSTLVAMDMDDKFIACLCHVPCDNAIQCGKRRHTVLLSVVHVEDFWCSDAFGGESVQFKNPDKCHIGGKTSSMFNLEAAVFESIQKQLNYQSEEPINLDKKACYNKYHKQYRPIISVSTSIVACGYGNFIVHVEMLAVQKNDTEERYHSTMYDPKNYLAIYSADAEEIIALHEISTGINSDTAMSKPSDATNLNSKEPNCWKLLACTDNSTRSANSNRSRSRASYVYVFQEQPPFLLILCRVWVESHTAHVDIVSVVDYHPQHIVSPVSSQDEIWDSSSVFAEIIPSSRLLAIAKNAVCFNDGKTLFKSILSFHNPSDAMTEEGGTYSTTAKSFAIENSIVDAISDLTEYHLLIIGRMCSGEDREDYVESSSIDELMEDHNTLPISQRQNMRFHSSRKREWNYFGSIIDVPTGSEIWRVQFDALLRDPSAFPADTSTFPCLIVAASHRDPCIVAIPLGLGIIMIRMGEVAYNDERSSANMGSVTKSKPKKKKKIVTTPNGKKDGFARGMSLR